MDEPPNIYGDDWDDCRDRPGWQWKRLALASRLEADKIGASVYELAPGQKTWPYHFHYGQPGGGKGGTCFGDSGGPILYDSTDIIVGVNSFVKNLNCAGSGFAYRIDTAETLNWILANADYTYGGITVVPYDGTTRAVTSPPS